MIRVMPADIVPVAIGTGLMRVRRSAEVPRDFVMEGRRCGGGIA